MKLVMSNHSVDSSIYIDILLIAIIKAGNIIFGAGVEVSIRESMTIAAHYKVHCVDGALYHLVGQW
jgi:ribosome biogenesis SPOUT family RNA methylase Rps3